MPRIFLFLSDGFGDTSLPMVVIMAAFSKAALVIHTIFDELFLSLVRWFVLSYVGPSQDHAADLGVFSMCSRDLLRKRWCLYGVVHWYSGLGWSSGRLPLGRHHTAEVGFYR